MRLSNAIENWKEFICKKEDVRAQTIRRSLVVLILVGIILRIFVAQLLMGGLNRKFQYDEVSYVGPATRIVQSRSFANYEGSSSSSFVRMPGLPLLLTIPISITGPNVVVIRIFMCLVGSLLIPACYLLGRSISDSRTARWMAIIAVFFPTWVYESAGKALSDIPTVILVTIMVWIFIEGYRRQSFLWFAGGGILWGMATLTRAASLAFAPGIVLWLLLVMPDWKKRLVGIVAVIVPLACILAPWSIRNTRRLGTFVLLSTQSGIELYKTNNVWSTGIHAYDNYYFDNNLSNLYLKDRYPNAAIRSKLYQSDAIKFIRENPQRFFELCMVRFVQFWKFYSPRVPVLQSLVIAASFGVALPIFLIQAVPAWISSRA